MKINLKKYPLQILDFVEHLGLVGFLFYTITVLGVLIWSAGQIIPQEGATATIFILIPVPYIIAEVEGHAFIAFYSFLWFSAAISIVYLLSEHVDSSRITKIRTWKESNLSAVFCVFAMVLAFSLLYQYLLIFLGTGIRAPAPPEQFWERLYLLTRASVWEEILVRFALIGVPMALIGIYRGEGNIKDVFGGFGFRKYWAIFVLLSVFIFTIGHLPGWNLWKLPQVFVPGLLFSYLFLKIGLHATIGVHLLWNFFGIPDVVLGNELYTGVMIFFFYIWLIVGIGIWLKIGFNMIKYRRNEDGEENLKAV